MLALRNWIEARQRLNQQVSRGPLDSPKNVWGEFGERHEEARMQEEQLRLPFREEHRALMRGLPGRRLFSTGAACRRNGGFDARRDENVPDTRTLSGES